jgi:long-chain fatty acid transport protein
MFFGTKLKPTASSMRCLAYILFMLWSSVLAAGGFQIALQGVKQAGMGGTGVANPIDGSAIYFNPGALSFTKKNSLNLNAFVLLPKLQFREEGTNKVFKMGAGTTIPFAGYWSWNTNPNQHWKLGVGVYTPFGTNSDWGSTWAGRYVTTSTKLSTYNIQPTFSYNIGNRVGIGAGFVYSRSSFQQNRSLPLAMSSGADGQVNLSSKANGYGFNAGVLVHVTSKLDIGASYKSSVKYNGSQGLLAYTVPDALTDSFPNVGVNTTMQLPWSVDMGITYKPEPRLTLGIDVNFVGWSAYKNVTNDFKQPNNLLAAQLLPSSYNNAATIRLGGSYDIDSSFTLRAGTYLDLAAVPNGSVSPSMPDANRFAITLGGTMHSGDRFELDLSFTYTESVRRTESQTDNYASLGGTYKGKSIAIGLGLNFNLGKRPKLITPETLTEP